MVESVSMTIGSSFALRPCAESTELILGVVGRALFVFPAVKLHAFNPLSNQLTDLVSSDDPEQIASFYCHVKTNISKELRRLHDLPYPIFCDQRIHPLPVAPNLESQEARFRYVLSQGTKEDLVESPRDWLGATGVHQLESDAPLYGPWFDRSAEDAARRRGQTFGRYEFATWYPVRLSPLPAWGDDPKWRERVTEITDDIEATNRARREDEGKTVLGMDAVMAYSPRHFPDEVEKSPSPIVLAASKKAYRALRRVFDGFSEAFFAASMRMREEPEADVEFPPYSFPPGRPMTPGPAPGLDLAFALEPD
jgi:hypothetical protein